MDFNWVANIPFLALASKAELPEHRPLVTRMIELVSVGIVTGVFGVYISDLRQQKDIEFIVLKQAEAHKIQSDINLQVQDNVVLSQKNTSEIQNIKDARAITRQETLQALIEINHKLDDINKRLNR